MLSHILLCVAAAINTMTQRWCRLQWKRGCTAAAASSLLPYVVLGPLVHQLSFHSWVFITTTTTTVFLEWKTIATGPTHWRHNNHKGHIFSFCSAACYYDDYYRPSTRSGCTVLYIECLWPLRPFNCAHKISTFVLTEVSVQQYRTRSTFESPMCIAIAVVAEWPFFWRDRVLHTYTAYTHTHYTHTILILLH